MARAIDVGYDIEKELNDIRHRMHGTQFEQDMIIIADAISYIQKLKGMSANGSVKHGKWSRPMEGKARLFQCNLCGGLTYTHGLVTRKPYDFCPHCGADMRGE